MYESTKVAHNNTDNNTNIQVAHNNNNNNTDNNVRIYKSGS